MKRLVLHLGSQLSLLYFELLDHVRTRVESSRYIFLKSNHAFILLATGFIYEILIDFELLADFVDFKHELIPLLADFGDSCLGMFDIHDLVIVILDSFFYVGRHSSFYIVDASFEMAH